MKLAVAIMLVATAARADRSVALDAGVVVGKPTGTFSSSSMTLGWYVSAEVLLGNGLSLFARYHRQPIDYVLPGTSALDCAPTTYGHEDFTGGARYAVALQPHLALFGELAVGYAKLTESSQNFAGGDDVSNGSLGVGGRIGVLVPIDGTFTLGAAVGYSWAKITLESTTDAWATLDVFVRAAF